MNKSEHVNTYNNQALDAVQQTVITDVVNSLCSRESYESVMHRQYHDIPMPSVDALGRIVEDLRAVLFPGYFGPSDIRPQCMHYYVGASLDSMFPILAEQIKRGFCFDCKSGTQPNCEEYEEQAHHITAQFVSQLSYIRYMLCTDVQAAYEGDPAAKHPGETIFCYPSIRCLTHYRIAHELHKLGTPLIPRIIMEMSHSCTGIDLHPGAQVGERFFIDHGTGVVIGETCIIGNNVRLYQGVTLGAKSFPKDEKGNLIKGIPRHPIVEDDVVIYAGATIFGRVTVGRGSIIGSNVWVMRDIPPGSMILQTRPDQIDFTQGAGI